MTTSNSASEQASAPRRMMGDCGNSVSHICLHAREHDERRDCTPDFIHGCTPITPSNHDSTRRVAITTDEGATVYAHINDDTQPETIDALKAIGDAIARMTPEQIEAMREKSTPSNQEASHTAEELAAIFEEAPRSEGPITSVGKADADDTDGWPFYLYTDVAAVARCESAGDARHIVTCWNEHAAQARQIAELTAERDQWCNEAKKQQAAADSYERQIAALRAALELMGRRWHQERHHALRYESCNMHGCDTVRAALEPRPVTESPPTPPSEEVDR